MAKQIKPTKIFGFILLGILIILVLNSMGLFSILEGNTVYTYGLNCDTTSCSNAQPNENSKVSTTWVLYYNSGEDSWRLWDSNPYYKNFFYSDWDIESTKSKEDSQHTANIWFKGMNPDFITQLKSSSKTQSNLNKYGEPGLFRSSYTTRDNKLDWWSTLSYVNDLESWKNDFFINKLCWVEFDSDLGLIKFYGKTAWWQSALSCKLVRPEYLYLDDVYVPVNLTEGSQYKQIEDYTGHGSIEFPAEDFEVKVDFTQTEFPGINPKPNQTCVNGEKQYGTCPDGFSYVSANCINSKWVPQESYIAPCTGHEGGQNQCTVSDCEGLNHIMCVGSWSISGTKPDCNCEWICGTQECTSDSDCLSTQTCSNGNCVDNTPSGNWYDFIFAHLFTVFEIDIQLWMGLVALVALFLIFR